MAATEKKSHKDWFDRAAAKAMAAQIASVHSAFDSKRFVQLCCKNLNELEFNGRVQHFATAMRETLPKAYPRAVKILEKSLPAELPDCESVTDGWLQWPVGQFIADHGLQHFDESMQCMVALTKRFSAEYAVRPFVQHYPQQTFEFLYDNMADTNPHVRRWCSEGCRTRLPWGAKLNDLIADPSPVLPILSALKDDPELYVRKSVANNLNDLSKDHPALVIDLCKDWSKNSNPHRDWIIKQGLRSMIKDGDKRALKLIGFAKPSGIEAKLSLSAKKLCIGDALVISATLTNSSRKKQSLLVDYIVQYQGKNDAARRKVFKWKTVELKAGEQQLAEKKQAFKRTTVRALYPGMHHVELQLNGEIVASTAFELTE